MKEQFAGWKERQGLLQRTEEGSEGGSEVGQKRGREDTLELEEESPHKKKRTVSDWWSFEVLLKFGVGPSEYSSRSVRLPTSEHHL